jgi:hypothetical protein
MMIEGSGSGRPKNTWIRIRIRNTALRPHVGPRLLMKIHRGFSRRSPKLRPVRISNLSWDSVLHTSERKKERRKKDRLFSQTNIYTRSYVIGLAILLITDE